MPQKSVNGTDLFFDVAGAGDTVVLVHGSWGDHTTWQPIVPLLAQSFRVVSYDRRGHSRSAPATGPGSRRQDEDDLAGLLEALDCPSAHIVGSSFGGSIALGLAVRRPELMLSAVAHEPPLLAVVADDPAMSRQLGSLQAEVGSVLDQIERGDIEEAAAEFVDRIALGLGMWDQLPEVDRGIMISNAVTFLDEQRDPEWAAIDLSGLARFDHPMLLTQGDQSPPWFRTVVAKLEGAVGDAEVRTFHGAGHLPHESNPSVYVATLKDFIRGSG